MIKRKLDDLFSETVSDLFQEGEDPAREKDQEHDGLLAIENSKLQLYPPDSKGRCPKIKPGENVIIKVNKQTITDFTVVKDESEVELMPKNEPPTSEFQFHLSENSVELVLETNFAPGNKYQLVDTEAVQQLAVETKIIEEIPPEPIDKLAVYEQLKEMHISDEHAEILHDNIEKALSSLQSTKTVIAKGRPMVPPTDGWIEYMFRTEERIQTQSEEDDRVNYFDQGEFNSVEIGETLAVLHPPVHGTSGITVTGKIIEPPEPKKPEIHAGKGVEILDDGQTAVATMSGRPTLSKANVISIVPELVISNNVDINTGHIKFRGDVKIHGDVKDGLNVNASGNVYISGSVFNGKIYGENGVTVNKNLIGSFISAGGKSAEFKKMLPLIKRLRDIINITVSSYEKLTANPKFSDKDLQKKGVGLLIKQILEMKFPDLKKTLEALENNLPDEYKEDEDNNLYKAVKFMNSKLIGHGPMKIKSIDELNKLGMFLSNIYDIIQGSLDRTAHVVFKNGQNAQIEATGEVTSTGNGIYHTDIIAGNAISISGFCKGGKLYATDRINVKELGSNTGVKTSVEVNEHGRITANTVYPEVLFKVGDTITKSQEKLFKIVYTIDNIR